MKTVFKRWSFLIFGVVFAAVTLPNVGLVQAQGAQKPQVVAIEIDGEIGAGTAQYVKRTVKQAESQKADLFLVNLNTPGGLLKATQEISDLLLNSNIKTAVFVHKEGGWAFSAGTFILLSAEIAVAHPDSSIGAAQPRLLGLEEAPKPDEKVISASASWIKTIASARGRNIQLAERFVRDNLTMSGKEAAKAGVINFTALNLEEILARLAIKDTQMVTLHPNLIENLLSFLSMPAVVSLLLTIGVLDIILVFRTGEVEVVGILAIIAFLLGLWGIGSISLSILGMAFLVIGIIFLAVEVFNPGFGVFGIVGTISLLAGIVFFGQEPYAAPTILKPTTFFALGASLATAALFIIIGRLTAKTLRSKPASGLEALIGQKASVRENLHPAGRIQIDHQSWAAKSIAGKIKSGEFVEIVDFSGNTLLVKKISKK